ncbi:MAG: branched-chain amino acid ABC transporter permease [Deltaproteobacteria bacterium]|nr:branched-chain amino acid ABC transporter permease [Deltaproteobacteria bacterium]
MARIGKLIVLLVGLWGLNWLIQAFAADVYAYELQILNLVGINIIMATSLNLINGITGQFSIGHAGFMAIGAYVSAAMTTFGDPWIATHGAFLPASVRETGWFLCALATGGGVAAAVGWCVGLPSLRLRGDYLAIATLGFGEIIRVVILNLDVVGGARGFPGIAERANFFWIYLFVCLTVWILWHLVRTPKGQGFYAVREDEIAAMAIGISTTRYKVTAFVIGAFFAGLGGGLFAHYLTYLHTNSFTFIRSFEFVAMVVLGGLGSFTGSILAAILLTALPELLRTVSEYRMILYSLLLIIFMLVRREGLLGRREFSWQWIRALVHHQRSPR